MVINGGVEENDKFFSKLLSREKLGNNNSTTSKQGEASFRVLYYGGATGSVPFTWESQPGTPKHTFNDNPLPPLTPPPSYLSSPRAAPPLLQRKHSSKNSKFFNSIFPRAPSKKINASNSPPASASASSSSSFSSSYSLPSSTPFNARKENFKARSRSTVRLAMEEEDEYDEVVVGRDKSPTSTLCFGPRNNGSPMSRRLIRGYSYPIKSVKKVVLSIVGHGNAAN